MDLAVAGHLGQRPLRPEPQGHATSASSPQYDRDEFEFDRDDLEEFLVEKATEAIKPVDLEPAREFLQEDWGRRSLAGWLHHKFGVAVDPADWAEPGQGRGRPSRSRTQARELYAQQGGRVPGPGRPDPLSSTSGRQGQPAATTATAWPPGPRSGSTPSSTPRSSAPCSGPRSRRSCSTSPTSTTRAPSSPTSSSGGSRRPSAPRRRTPRSSPPPDAEALAELAAWARQELGVETTADELAALGRDEARLKLVNALDAKHRPEMREMEKVLVLQILDSSWMEHLRAMDHLRSSVGLQGYAQVDPKVEYKREGMKIFAEMWTGVSDKVTDLIFRVEQFDPEFLSYLGARWQLDRAADDPPGGALGAGRGRRGSNIRAQQEAAIAASQQAGREEARAGPQRWQKGRPERPLPLRVG